MAVRMLIIDGSRGEGGGQILRTALGLSALTGQPFRMQAIRAKRKKPGLLRQHLTCVQAAAAICGAQVEGAQLGASELVFTPGMVRAGDYRFAIGSAGSTTLVLQTVLLALLRADAPSTIFLEGGTHNSMSPPFDFLLRTFLPLLARMGAPVSATLERPGFYPAGGGAIAVRVEPGVLQPLTLLETIMPKTIRATATVANLARSIAERELAAVGKRIGVAHAEVVEIKRALGPGNVLTVEVESASLCEVFTGFGEKNRSAESVAEAVCTEVSEYLAVAAPVGRYLADQLLLPLALAGSGAFRTLSLSEHSHTQIDTVRMFLDVPITTQVDGAITTVTVG